MLDLSAMCPVCNESASLDTYQSRRADGLYEVTLYRCPNGAVGRQRDRFGMPKKPTPGRHPIHKVERKLEEDMPIISPELRELVISVRKVAGLTVNQFAETVPIGGNYLSQVLSQPGTPASDKVLTKIERATEALERKLGYTVGFIEQSPPGPTKAFDEPKSSLGNCPSADNAQCNADCPCEDRSPDVLELFTPVNRLDLLTTAMQSVEQRLFTLEHDTNNLAKESEGTDTSLESMDMRIRDIVYRLEQIEDDEPEIDVQLVRVERAGGDLLQQATAILRLVPWAEREDLLKIVNHHEQLERLQAKFRVNLRAGEETHG